MVKLTSLVIGDGSLLIECSEQFLARGHQISGVVTSAADVAAWAQDKGFEVIAPGKGLAARLKPLSFDWLFSIANLRLLGRDVLDLPKIGALNFHDGPLPKYAGLNAPVWALINGETRHGITWHMIAPGVDSGDIIEQRTFDLSPEETALTLNTKCFEAGIEGFAAVLDQLATGAVTRHPQDLSARSYVARDDRPAAAGRLDFECDASVLAALVRGLDHGDYWNPLCVPKIESAGQLYAVSSARIGAAFTEARPGTVLESKGDSLTVATGKGALRLMGLTTLTGAPMSELPKVGDVLPSLDQGAADAATKALAAALPHEADLRQRLKLLAPCDMPFVTPADGPPSIQSRKVKLSAVRDEKLAAICAALTLTTGAASVGVALISANWPDGKGALSNWAPFCAQATPDIAAFDAAMAAGPFAADLPLRDPALRGIQMPQVAIARGNTFCAASAVTFALTKAGVTVYYDTARISDGSIDLLLMRLSAALEGTGDVAEMALQCDTWNQTQVEYDKAPLHSFFEAQAQRTPDAEAVVFEDRALSYAALNARANQVAHVLRAMGVGPGMLVGLYTRRSVEMLVGALAILKAGGAYVPLDPGYPADRIAHYIKDSAAPVILTQAALSADLPDHTAQVLEIDADPRLIAAPETNPDSGVTPKDLAYLIYTSGSTGTPKGVMVEHGNVANFFAGMDARIDHSEGSVWLAVTSLSFDISVLELFYTLARGFKVVVSGDENRAIVSSGRAQTSAQPVDFSIYYWGNDDVQSKHKYELLLEGAKYADANGFVAVWTPERHFHAFGGPYPNPSVTGAAVAAVTQNISVRAGSIVAPLHHPARIAEEWAVIDNLTGGRVGLAIASGWQPDDFVLRPENTPPTNKTAMFDTIRDIRKLWKGEPVAFPRQSGEPLEVVTQPRPMSDELPIWVTTAGNPETWKDAARHGANVLTHLLGQSIDEVAEKIALYHATLREHGFDPKDRTVTLMLHTFVGQDREEVREIVRGPMTDYLRAAAGLIKQYAWAFPAFKKPKGVDNAFQLDLETLSDDELDGILEFAFQRYFEDAGLFGTVEDCVARVESLKAIGVGEVACLIDYGIDTQTVLAGLRPLTQVHERCNEVTELDADDFSIAAQIQRHGVTHLQCTPSMARMLVMNDESRAALASVKHLMIGGEALPGALVADLVQATDATIENMYGPTETTIWSTTQTARAGQGTIDIGRPIANTQVYVLDDARQPVPIGHSGELYIGGDGVTRGYWQREDLTADRFVANPFGEGRLYRTGDLVKWSPEGVVEFIGRVDHQVKLRGHRIELGEIENALEGLADVTQAVVIAREDQPGDTRLVAYLKATSQIEPDMARKALSASLPDYMLPAHFVMVEAFALTPNKKVDRNALPAPVRQASKTAAPKASPAPLASGVSDAGVETQLARIWSRILGVEGIGSKDSFFDLGGHSLLAVQAHREIKAEMNVTDLSITDIFRFPTLGALAARIQPKTPDAVSAPVDRHAVEAKADARTDAMARRRAMRAARMQRRA